MEKLKFEFMVKASEDMKTNIICVTRITDLDGRTFAIPDNLQPIKLHGGIIHTQIFQKVKSTLQKRHEKRQVWISMNPEMKAAYCDEDGNKQFMGYILEEQPKPQISTTGISEESLARIMENFAEMKKDSLKPFNMGKVVEKFVIEKLNSKITNVSQWMTTFETECLRIGIEEDIKKIEIFRLFLEDSCLDWYNSMLIKHTINSKWAMWKKNFCETYADKKTSESESKEKNMKPMVIPCKICEKENKGIRYHPESKCWFKIRNNDKPKKDQIRSVNNSELEVELNKIDPKN
ncbi:unnamed protein product [Euphydryas editha]|uniref:Uncharacterized protein n=1 Tax=Euphydryas editha TaxID=104508 RepID=A0AAU9V7Z9_EUPED|nr:unnamed protein product [Euphydryas editha]